MSRAAEGRTRPTDAKAMVRLRARAERRARVALMGEFSAGKSTLVNLLVEREVAPTQVTATQAPPLWLSHAVKPSAETVDAYGRRNPIPVEHCREVGSDEAVLVRLHVPAAGLLRHDVIDTPGLSDPLLAEDVLERTVRHADVALWCTSAMQAWRRSEHAAWTALPRRVRRRGLLVVTHADRLTERERRRVLTRLERETEGLFHDRVLVSATEAARARAQGAGGAALWEESGGARLMAAIEGAVSDLEGERRGMLARYEVRVDAPPPRVRAAANVQPHRARVASAATSPLRLFDEEAAALPAAPDAAAMRALAQRVTERAAEAGDRAAPWLRLLRAHDFEAIDPWRLMRQMRGEVADFADGEWCDLGPASPPFHGAEHEGSGRASPGAALP